MTGSTARSELASFFARASEACKEAIADHASHASTNLRFQQQMLLALAALAGCEPGGEPGDADVRLVRTASSAAAATCRTQAPDACVVALAHCLDGVVRACDALLGDGPAEPGWRRFLFADADVEVLRLPRGWRTRTSAASAEDTLLDVALERVGGTSATRIAAMTVQILDWYAHDRP